MIACRLWKRIDCARAFSSDMWLTPKNWLSPNRILSMAGRGTSSIDMGAGSADDTRPESLARRGRSRRDTFLRRADEHRDDAVGLERRGERVLAVEAARANAFREVVDLRRVLLAAEIEPDLVRKVGRVANRPARVDSGQRLVALAQKQLTLLPVGDDAAV